jgi:hypothetical protein
MKQPRIHYTLGLFLKYFIYLVAVFLGFVVLSSFVDMALEKNTRFNCWKLEQYAATYPAFWITHDEDVACRSVDIIINAEVRK